MQDKSYEPFIHGTNSSIFATLQKCQFQIMSPLVMMRVFKAGPITGELIDGGYKDAGTNLIEDDWQGKTSFAKLSTVDESYTLEKIISCYTHQEVYLAPDSLNAFKGHVKWGSKIAYQNINLLLIYFSQCRQYFDSLDEIISEVELKELFCSLDAVIHYYAFLQLLKKHIHVNANYINSSSEKHALLTSVSNSLQFDFFAKNWMESNVNIVEIAENPIEENLIKVINFLQKFQGNSENLFSLHSSYDDKFEKICEEFCENIDEDTRFIIKELMIQHSSKKEEKRIEKLKKNTIAFKDRIALLRELVEAPQFCFSLSDSQKFLLKKPVPLVFLSTSDSIKNFGGSEYRSMCPLTLGKELTTIATDTHKSRLMLLKYLDLHDLRNVLVILLDDLTVIRAQKKKIATPYQHADGFPKLQWLAAKEIKDSPENGLNLVKEIFLLNNFLGLGHAILNKIISYIEFIAKETKMISPKRNLGFFNESMYSQKNMLRVFNLIDDAQQYHEIKFGT